ncbi:MAG TPA: hypothetical protein VH479_17040 [Acidimicrobiales bacterium]|jgi:hypothetical protein
MGLARRYAAGMALAGLIVAGLGACSGGGDDDSSSDTTEPGHGTTETSAAEDVDIQTFCQGFTAIDKAFFQMPNGADALDAFVAANITPNVEPTLANAPPELAGSVQVLLDGLDQAITTSDFTVFGTPDYVAAQTKVYRKLADTCGLASLHTVAIDYSYQGIPATLPAGTTVVTIDNESAAGEFHELTIARINDGVTDSAEQILAMSEADAGARVTLTASASAEVGEVGGATIDLVPGRYMYACFVAMGSTGAQEGTGEPHYSAGMFGEFTVA